MFPGIATATSTQPALAASGAFGRTHTPQPRPHFTNLFCECFEAKSPPSDSAIFYHTDSVIGHFQTRYGRREWPVHGVSPGWSWSEHVHERRRVRSRCEHGDDLFSWRPSSPVLTPPDHGEAPRLIIYSLKMFRTNFMQSSKVAVARTPNIVL